MLELSLVVIWNVYMVLLAAFVLYLHAKHRPLSWRELLFFVLGVSVPVIPMIGMFIL